MSVADVAITTIKPGRFADALADAGQMAAYYQERGAVTSASILYHAGSSAVSLLSVIGHADLAAHGAFWEKVMAEPSWMELRMRQDAPDAAGTLASFQLIRSLPGFEPAEATVGTAGWITSLDVLPGRAEDLLVAMAASKATMVGHGLTYSASMVLSAGFDAPGTRVVTVISAAGVAAFGAAMEQALNDPAVLENVNRLWGGADAPSRLAGRTTYQRII